MKTAVLTSERRALSKRAPVKFTGMFNTQTEKDFRGMCLEINRVVRKSLEKPSLVIATVKVAGDHLTYFLTWQGKSRIVIYNYDFSTVTRNILPTFAGILHPEYSDQGIAKAEVIIIDSLGDCWKSENWRPKTGT